MTTNTVADEIEKIIAGAQDTTSAVIVAIDAAATGKLTVVRASRIPLMRAIKTKAFC